MARKRRRARQSADLYDEIVVDLFAGGGGASVGIEAALGRAVDLAVNHDRAAVAMHAANHPHTHHLRSDVFEVDPREAVGGRRVGLLWASPDCTYHSKARGAKPIRSLNAKRRALAWVVVRWAHHVRPRVIMLENVEEFADWCPLVPRRHANGKIMRDAEGSVLMRPCERRKGQTFRRWVRELRRLGYAVEWRELRACDYGSPTTRKRLFVIARYDGQPIVWPEKTHGVAQAGGRGDSRRVQGRPLLQAAASGAASNLEPLAARRRQGREAGSSDDAGAVNPLRTAAECIDWSLPCPSIFLSTEEAKAIGCKRPLKPATMARIARGVKRYIIDAAEPFIVPLTHRGGARGRSTREPAPTITGAHRGEHALVAPAFVPRYGERDGQAARCRSVDRPAPTIVPAGNGAQLVAAYLAQHNGGMVGHDARKPLSTLSSKGAQQQVVAAFMSAAHQGGASRPVSKPMRTVTASAKDKHQVVTAYLGTNTTGHAGSAATEPAPTVTTGGQQFVAACLSHQRGAAERGSGGDVRGPVPTITAAGTHAALVYAFLASYYGQGIGQPVDHPLRTVPTHERFAVVMVDGVEHVITDIGMRMLTPRELFRCQGFGEDYVIDLEVDGRPLTKTEQVRLVGNSVCPQVAEALVRANLPVAACSELGFAER